MHARFFLIIYELVYSVRVYRIPRIHIHTFCICTCKISNFCEFYQMSICCWTTFYFSPLVYMCAFEHFGAIFLYDYIDLIFSMVVAFRCFKSDHQMTKQVLINFLILFTLLTNNKLLSAIFNIYSSLLLLKRA